MMSNPRTTILGVLAIAGAVLAFLTKFFQGEPVTLDEALAIASAISAGVVGVVAKDGGQ